MSPTTKYTETFETAPQLLRAYQLRRPVSGAPQLAAAFHNSHRATLFVPMTLATLAAVRVAWPLLEAGLLALFDRSSPPAPGVTRAASASAGAGR